MEVKGKRVVVTGAASGIGEALCEAFNDADTQSVVCVDLNLEGAKKQQILLEVWLCKLMLE